MIQPFAAALLVYSLGLWLFPTPSPSIPLGFTAMVPLLALARQRGAGVLPGFVATACGLLLLLYLLPAVTTDFGPFASLFIAVYCGFILVLRYLLGPVETWLVSGLVTALMLALESRYYGNPGYNLEPLRSLALLTLAATLITLPVAAFLPWMTRLGRGLRRR